MKKSIIYLAVLPLLVACNHGGGEEVQQPLTPFEKGQLVYITSQSLNKDQSSNPSYVHAREEVAVQQSEVHADDQPYVTHIYWDEGDQIDVFVDTTTTQTSVAYPKSVFNLVSGANTQEGTFRGEMPAAGNTYAFMYPHRDGTIVEDYTEGNLYPYQVTQFEMPAVQTYRSPDGNTYNDTVWPTFASGLLPIFGKGDLDNKFSLQVCGGALRFKLYSSTGETVRSIVLRGRKDENLSGTFMITPDSATSLRMDPKTGGTGRHAVILQMKDNSTLPTTQDNAVWIYFVLPAPLIFTSGFGIYTYDVEITNENASTAKPTHIFVTEKAGIQIKQGHVTTINFKNTGNQGNIHGADWNKPAPEQ